MAPLCAKIETFSLKTKARTPQEVTGKSVVVWESRKRLEARDRYLE
jgi:hypothetical protein